ncbi:MAG: shikimate dehydrogenase [Bacteroidetes bacterium]|nr:shikimate dehydrogenase [Bacteroidota bacterium]MBS1648683.1 shikimate dehydrogenase [Bacteroidota bacterium]
MKIYGLIGYPLSHSFSKKYFDEKFVQEKISNAIFENFSIENIRLLKEILSRKELKGFAVTIPYKKEVIAFLHESNEVVKQINACNCVKIKDGKLYGYNTDVIGFEKSFVQQLQPHHTKALILGTGGAAAAVEYVLQKLNIPYKFVSRTKQVNNFTYNELNEVVMNEYSIIINTSPLGTYPNVEECPAIPYQLLTAKHYLYDLVYNPTETKFLRLGKEKNCTVKNGYDMLVLQAEENWKIWNER